MAEASPDTSPTSESHWIVPLRTLAIVMGVFGLTCLGVLVVVTAIDNVDALSTVALSLAILAFSVQLIVFVAQQGFAAEQSRRNEELYGSMQGAIAEIREKAARTQADVQTMNEQMLQAVIAKNIASSPEGQVDPTRLLAQLQQVSQPEVGSGFEIGGRRDIWPERRPGPHDAERLQMLTTFPSEDEVGDALDLLRQLPDADRRGLKSFGDDEIIALQPGYPFDPSLTVEAAGGLGEFGLVQAYPAARQPRDAVSTIYHLTDRGRQVARLLTAPGDPPPYLDDLREIRASTTDRMPWQRFTGESAAAG